jgi:hypothetical protein
VLVGLDLDRRPALLRANDLLAGRATGAAADCVACGVCGDGGGCAWCSAGTHGSRAMIEASYSGKET